eukprot:6395392-Amphidinium_carterae.1
MSDISFELNQNHVTLWGWRSVKTQCNPLVQRVVLFGSVPTIIRELRGQTSDYGNHHCNGSKFWISSMRIPDSKSNVCQTKAFPNSALWIAKDIRYSRAVRWLLNNQKC